MPILEAKSRIAGGAEAEQGIVPVMDAGNFLFDQVAHVNLLPVRYAFYGEWFNFGLR